jgi:hypothetical protein
MINPVENETMLHAREKRKHLWNSIFKNPNNINDSTKMAKSSERTG